VPNDVPLNNFQAQFNESLLQMFSGFHPEAYWEVVVNNESNEEGDYPPPREPAGDDSPAEAQQPPLETLDESPAEEDGSEKV